MTHPPHDPAYYATELDLDVLDALDNFNRHDAVHVVTDRPVDPLSDDAVVEGYEIRVARATPEELAEWRSAYAALCQRAGAAADKLAAAKAAWEKARAEALGELHAAYADYEHVHDTIDKRHDEVQRLRGEAANEKTRAENAEAARRQAEEDAELGPRTWVIHELTTVDANYFRRKKTPEMYLPTIHVAGCPVTDGRERYDYEVSWRYARAGEVEMTLRQGGQLASNGVRTERRAPARLCGRCKPEASLRAAGLGEAFEAWRAQADAVQPPRPLERYVPKKLGLEDEWFGGYRRPGYREVDVDTYVKEGAIHPYEVVIGWWTGERWASGDPLPEELLRLEQILPERGVAVRRFNELERWGGKPFRAGVAVRYMTEGELRQRREDAAALAAHQEHTGPAQAIPLEDA
jgi:hypothetical protein